MSPHILIYWVNQFLILVNKLGAFGTGIVATAATIDGGSVGGENVVGVVVEIILTETGDLAGLGLSVASWLESSVTVCFRVSSDWPVRATV